LFSGHEGNEHFRMTYSSFDRVTNFTSNFMVINNYNGIGRTKLISDYSGYIGLQPYTANEAKKESNFLW